MTVADRAAAGFRQRYGTEPAGRWAAPGRVNLIGEHTDYNDGFVLPFALPLRTVVAAAPAPDGRWTVWSELDDEPVEFGTAEADEPGGVDGWAAYVAGVVWALRAAGHDVPGARLAVASDVPVGSGLSSSAAIESAVLAALVDLGGLDLPAQAWPRLAQRAENDYVGAPTGIMDQSAVIRGRAGHALFLDCRTEEVEQIPFDLDAAGLAVLVIDSRAPHRHADGEYAARRRSCERAAATLGVTALRDVDVADLDAALARLDDDETRRRVRHVVTENQRVLDTVALLRAGRVRDTGPLLTASHASMRDDFEITVPEIDTAVEAALSAGAYGARMTGGGFGGCVLALVDAEAADPVAAAVTEAYAKRGFTAPGTLTVLPADGVTRLG
ncbi:MULTISPECIES: galactokinase [Micromonospora]|uniref:galactokinase n=1 Tax=Micromonospora TaxID=1873 RepID=UPI0003EEB70D|nr:MULTISPECIES: galactokinase [unclassified Micromonospora]EWM66065.1 galactokinase [Micromonospora sp. M42]MBP1780840.1 galactokinase [Micromonospora sp. HB375]MCK1808533.1 galactokinase [Micromonospora sp. R42106]MCK1833026.1 galactokinase [Micromonospora sp. R42003]MCK1844905.1 galactokinase [Micromonospora sp. R42004]